MDVPVDATLLSDFQKAADGKDNIAWFQVEIKEEKLLEAKSAKKSGNVASDYDGIVTAATELNGACYFLISLSSDTKQWIFLTYVPDTVTVKDKMLMASAKNMLKDKLGHQYFADELHATTTDELNYEYYKSTQKEVDVRSDSERLLANLSVQEEEARTEQEQQHVEKVTAKTNPSASARASVGGYHAVEIPLSSDAQQQLEKYKSGSVNFVQLAINDTKDGVNAPDAKSVSSLSAAGTAMHTSEPRFYLYKHQSQNVFIYCCPDKSPAKLRMVYSTAKPGVAEQVGKSGISLAAKRVEIREGSELADELSVGTLNKQPNLIKVAPGRMTGGTNGGGGGVEGGGTVKTAQHLSRVGEKQHPIYGIMGSGNGPSTGKKKIVLPPPGAW